MRRVLIKKDDANNAPEKHIPSRNIGSPGATPKTMQAVNSSLVP